MSAQPAQNRDQKNTAKKEVNRETIRALTHKVSDRNDKALRRLSKN